MVNNRWARLSQNEKAELLGIYTSMGYNDLASIIAHYNSCGGKLKADGGPVVNTAQYKSDAYLYTPPVNVGAPIEVPLRYKPLPDYGDYVPQRTTGMLEDIPIELGLETPQRGYGVLMSDAPSAMPTLDARQDAARRIMAVENSKNNVNGGYDAKTGRWYPHKSHEGGADTIAYGIKLSNGTPEAALALKQGYLTDEQAVNAVDTLVQKYYNDAKKVYDKRFGEGEWNKLSDKSQSILVDYSYNPGLSKFTKLMDAFHSGDKDGILKEYKRYSGKKELGRNKMLFEEIQTLGNEYPIFRADGGKIHIAPSKRGTFTAAAKRHGKSVQAFASQVLANKENYSSAMVKKANFARNSRKWKHGDGGPLDNYFYDGGPYGVVPLGGDYLNYLQTMPEVSGGSLEPAVVTASLPEKFNGSQEAARRYAEGYQKGAKPVSEAMNRAGQDIFNTIDTVVGLTPTPAGAISWFGHMGADTANGEYGKVGRDLAMAAAMGLGLKAIGKGATYLKNYWDEIGNFGEDTFRAFIDSNLKIYKTPKIQYVPIEYMEPIANSYTSNYQIDNLGGGYMLKSLMRGNPLEKQISKNGTVNVNNVKAIVGKGSKVEQAVVDKVLASEEFAGKKSVDYNKFRKAVQDELITYERTPNKNWNNYGIDRLGIGSYMDAAESPEMINKFNEFVMNNFSWDPVSDLYYIPGDPSSKSFDPNDLAKMFFEDGPGVLDTPVGITKRLNTFTFSSPRIPQGSNKHYNANTLGHSRTYTTADEPDILHVMESQSDWAQSRGQLAPKHAPINITEENFKEFLSKHPELEFVYYKNENDLSPGWSAAIDGLEKEYPDILQYIKKTSLKDTAEANQVRYLSDNYTSRQIQENLRYAAEKGQKKMRYPTRETAAKIEGYEKRNVFIDESGNRLDPLNDRTKIYTRGSDVDKEISDLIEMRRNARKITELQEIDGKLEELYKINEYVKPGLTGTTQYTTGGIDNSAAETILRKYDAFPKQYQKLYKGADIRTVTDPKGNTWYEVDVPEGYLGQEWAYKYGGKLREFSNISDIF